MIGPSSAPTNEQSVNSIGVALETAPEQRVALETAPE